MDINGIVDNYVANLEEVLYGVESFITNKNGYTNVITQNNPIDSLFGHLHIEDEETHLELSIFDMEVDELNAFISLYLDKEKEFLQGVLSDYPELTQNIERGNYILEQVKATLGMNRTTLTNNIISYQDFNTALNNVVDAEQNGENVLNRETGFDEILWNCPYCGEGVPMKEVLSHHCRQMPNDPVPDPPLTPQELLAEGIRYADATKGDIIITLAGDNGSSFVHPVFLEAVWSNANPSYQVGHVGIFNFTPRTTDSNSTILDGETIEAWHGVSSKSNTIEHQVMYRSIYNWSNATAVYVLGLQHWKLKWKWRGFKSGVRYVYTPVQDPSLLATEANEYIGTPYSSWTSFGWSKWRTPDSFQCASLVWYCTKQVYGSRLAPFLSLTVTPANIFFDKNTYIKKRIIVEL